MATSVKNAVDTLLTSQCYQHVPSIVLICSSSGQGNLLESHVVGSVRLAMVRELIGTKEYLMG